ncbi:hypothetical protein DIPPA_06765 [Diplonema papillatum]|nr:hypothetical protein DIPPA_05694 [Diplonema papillatum]KAJ9458221.1 hypothetical protein DIPPA_06765 [Diplonema papillatum]
MFALMCIVGAALGLAPHPREPTPWPTQFTTTLTENQTSPDGRITFGFMTQQKQYDYSKQAVRVACSHRDTTSVFLAIGFDGWVWNTQNRKCVHMSLPVSRVSPDWMVGGEFVGSRVYNGADSWCYEKLEHIYCQSKATAQPTYVFAPTNQKGWSVDDAYNVFIPGVVSPPDAFEIPSYCSNSTKPPFGLTCPDPPPEEDPGCCFLPMYFATPSPTQTTSK